MPDFSRLHTELSHKGFSVIGIAMPFDRPDMIVETNQRMQLSYPVALDITGEANRAFGDIQVIPTSFLLDPDSKIVKKYSGAVTYDKLKKELEKQQSIFKKGS